MSTFTSIDHSSPVNIQLDEDTTKRLIEAFTPRERESENPPPYDDSLMKYHVKALQEKVTRLELQTYVETQGFNYDWLDAQITSFRSAVLGALDKDCVVGPIRVDLHGEEKIAEFIEALKTTKITVAPDPYLRIIAFFYMVSLLCIQAYFVINFMHK